MPVSKALINLLDKNKIKYEVLEHRKVYTAFDLAKTLHLDPKQIGKDVIVKVDGDYVIAVIPATKNLDVQKLKKLINVQRKKEGRKAAKKVNFATETWIKKRMKGKVGANPPFGTLQKLPVYLERALMRVPKMIVNGGDYTYSISLTPKQFVKLENPVLGSFSKAKK